MSLADGPRVRVIQSRVSQVSTRPTRVDDLNSMPSQLERYISDNALQVSFSAIL